MPRDNISLYKLMFSCPSDAENYLPIIEKVIKKFNRDNIFNIYIEVMYWKKDTFPETRNPQESINNQLVDECDLDIAIFDGKLGSRTKNYLSGTDEEINRFRKMRKQVFVYFFEGLRSINSKLDANELLKVMKFKERYQLQGDIFYSTFQTQQDLYEGFYDHLMLYFRKKYTTLDNKMENLELERNLYRLANMNFEKRNYNSALSLFEECKNIRDKYCSLDREQSLKILSKIEKCHLKLNNWDKVIEIKNSRIDIYKEKFGCNSIELVHELESLGYSLDHFGDYNSALNCFNKALEILNGYHEMEEYEIVYASCGRGYINRVLGNYKEAQIDYSFALKYITHNNCKKDFIAFVYNGIGSAYMTTNFELALNYLNEAKSIREELVSKGICSLWQVANTNKNIGAVYYYHHDYEKALEYQENAMRLEQKESNSINLGKSYVSIARTLIAKDKSEFINKNTFLAIKHLEQALKCIKEKHKRDVYVIC